MSYDETQEKSLLEGIDLRARGTLLLVRSDVLGQEDGLAGRELVRDLLVAIAEGPEVPETVVLMGSGLWLLEDAAVRACLERMHGRGVDLVTCKSSAARYPLKTGGLLGREAGMEELAAMLFMAERVLEF